MEKKLGISLRIDEAKIAQIDLLAESTQRDRTFLITEAIDNYLEIQKWQIDHIKAAIKQADAKKFVSEADVARTLKKWQS